MISALSSSGDVLKERKEEKEGGRGRRVGVDVVVAARKRCPLDIV